MPRQTDQHGWFLTDLRPSQNVGNVQRQHREKKIAAFTYVDIAGRIPEADSHTDLPSPVDLYVNVRWPGHTVHPHN